MGPDPQEWGITSGIGDGATPPRPAVGGRDGAGSEGTIGPPSPCRVDAVAGSWAAMAAYCDRTDRLPGTEIFRALAAQGVPDDDIDAALALFDLEQETVLAGLRGRVEDLDAEVEEALAEQNRAEVAAFGEAAVVFAHAVQPDASTLLAAVDAMTPVEWLVFERLAEDTAEDDATGAVA